MNQIFTSSNASAPALPLEYVADLDTPLLMFSEDTLWSLRDAAEGVLITGGIGSGKSSSAGFLLAQTYLRAGFGGLVCCVNVDEVDRWRRYAADTGRTKSLIVVDGSLAQKFNFLEYQMTVGRRSAFEAVNVLVEILNAAEGRVQETSGQNAFWDTAMREILTKTITPLWAAYGRLTLAEMMRFIHDRPKTPEQIDPDREENKAYFENSFWVMTMRLATVEGGFNVIDPDDVQPIFDYWTMTMTQPDQKTPGNIVQTLTGRLDPFTTGELRKLFCTETTFVPELTFDGAIIVLDLSAHEWGKEGILGQHIVKLMWQKAMQRRPKTPDARPVFLFADEAQYMLAASDQAFASTSRACKALTVYITQNLPGVYARISGPDSQNVTDALLANLGTVIAHSQTDSRTATWLSERIGKEVQWRQNVGTSENESTGTNRGHSSGSGSGSSNSGTNSSAGIAANRGASQVVDYRVQPSHFGTLRKGGGPDRMSEAIVFQSGRQFAYTGSTWTPVLFRQG